MAERNVQVVRMRDIYVHATRVFIWLGPSAFESDLALNTLKAIVEFETKFTAEADQSITEGDLRAQSIQRLPADGRLLDSADSADNATPWIALGRFFKRVWWFRAWIIQEATCKNETIFHCGTSTISWNDLTHACSVLMNTGSHSVGTYVLENEGFYRFSRMVAFYEQRHKYNDQLDFLTVLSTFRTAEATDLRDKVYAGVGLMQVSMQKHIVVNYDDTIVKVYTDAASAFIQATGSLDVLAHCDVDIGIPGLPSWAPDWTIWTGIKELTHRFPQQLPGGEAESVAYDPLYQCTKNSRAHAQLSSDSPTLILTGATLDTLASMSSPYLNLDSPPADLPERAWRSFAADFLPSATYRSGEPIDTATRRTLVADKMCGLLGIPKKRGFAMVWPEQRPGVARCPIAYSNIA
jgi:hypothetical protein